MEIMIIFIAMFLITFLHKTILARIFMEGMEQPTDTMKENTDTTTNTEG